jgi:hypothetical protein
MSRNDFSDLVDFCGGVRLAAISNLFVHGSFITYGRSERKTFLKKHARLRHYGFLKFNSDIRAEVYKRQYGRELRKGVEGKVV